MATRNKWLTVKKTGLIVSTFVTTAVLVVVFMTIGSVDISLSEIIHTLRTGEEGFVYTIIMRLRLPRNIMAVIVGMNISVAGLLMQAVMKNPLADPGITGISSGAAVVAIFILLTAPHLVSFLPLFAFIGGALACFIVFMMAWRNGIDPLRVVLSGVAVNAVLGGVISILSLIYSDRIKGALLWLNGSLSTINWGHIHMILPYSVVALLVSFFLVRSANVLQLGDEAAKNLGYHVTKTRLLLSSVSVFLAGITVSIVGIVGFVGLIVPHVARLLLGSDHKYTLPFSMAFGGLVLLVADTVGRSMFGALEIPVGIITSMVGGPLFLFLLRKRGDTPC